MNLPKIKIGKSKRDRAKFNLTHDVNTTADFGSVLPLMCRELVPGTKMDVSVDSFVRLAPMVVPTFGRVSYRTYHQFVPITEVYEPFENLMAGQKYNGINSSYIPNEVPNIRMDHLAKYALSSFATFSIYKGKNNKVYDPSSTSIGAGIVKNASLLTSSTDINSAIDLINGAWSDSLTNTLTELKAVNASGLDANIPVVTIEGADFVYSYTATNTVGSDVFIVCFRLTKRGRNFRKALVGCGYQLSLDSQSYVSFLPLMAFYKAYFDVFVPQLTLTWTDTPFYAYGNLVKNDYTVVDLSLVIMEGTDRDRSRILLNGMLQALADCYYYGDNNYYSAHILQPNLNLEDVLIVTTGTSGMTTAAVTQDAGSQGTGTSTISRFNILKKLYTWSNKNSVIGGRIAEYMKAHFGADCLDELESNYIGTDTLACQIGDVMATSDTAGVNAQGEKTGADIGEYAGKGIGYANGETLKFTARTFGYWVTLAVVVPTSGFYQGIDPNLMHISRFTFYNPEFDALGFQISTKDIAQGSSAAYHQMASVHSDNTNTTNFGYIPRYSEMKVANNVVNGDMSRRGSKDSMLPYCLDYNLQETKVVGLVNDDNPHVYDFIDLYNNARNLPIGDPVWRSIGEHPELGQFDRIFYNDSPVYDRDLFNQTDVNPIDDNFIIHNVLNVHMFAPMKPISESFETEGESNDAMAVEKA